MFHPLFIDFEDFHGMNRNLNSNAESARVTSYHHYFFLSSMAFFMLLGMEDVGIEDLYI